MTIVVIDDDRINLKLIDHLVAQFGEKVQTFRNPLDALEMMAQCHPKLLITDYRMPEIDGLELVRRVTAMRHLGDLPILMVTATEDRRVRLQAFAAGVTDFLTKPIDPTELRARARVLLRLADAQAELRDRARPHSHEGERATAVLAARETEIIFRLARAGDRRDHESGNHVLRVAGYARLIAEQLRLPAAMVQMIHLAAPLHDVGKIGVPDCILLKPGRLTAEERAEMQKHTDFGIEILGGSSWELLNMAADIAAGHHERWDGAGYPLGLAGEKIQLAARVVAVADVFDALTSERVYKRAWSLDEARSYVFEQRGGHFDPACVDAFLARWDDVVSLAARERGHDAALPAELAKTLVSESVS